MHVILATCISPNSWPPFTVYTTDSSFVLESISNPVLFSMHMYALFQWLLPLRTYIANDKAVFKSASSSFIHTVYSYDIHTCTYIVCILNHIQHV